MKKKLGPNYQKIYGDIIREKFPDKLPICKRLLEKKDFNTLDIIEMNALIFKDTKSQKFDQKHRSFDNESIIKILKYQKENGLNNTQVSKFYRLSRNTITKWKRLYGKL